MKQFTFDAIVIGSGATGYNAACRIRSSAEKTVALITENIRFGTSRNTGSDKQTYYKLGLGGSSMDSVRQMALDLFHGGSVDGDNALCEAALSTRCFLRLCELGVEFPTNRWGEYVGYKTDHDPYARATSAGPLTSRYMTEALEQEAARLQLPVFDGHLAIELLRDNSGICGVLCLDQTTLEFVAFRCANVILATGGPAGIYADSVYPTCHTGSTGLALRAGAAAQNLTHWQYGLASVDPRWNVSGTYMQVLPRIFSVGPDGKEHEFLLDFFQDPYEALSTLFLKGYQWPFDSKKVLGGSSVIDLLVYRECVLKNRTVWLDYTQNPFGFSELSYEKLSCEAQTYLSRAESCFGRPIDRLLKMNAPAVELYKSKGVDLTKEPLQIALCAQHHNGGIAVDAWWQTNVPGLFAAGECAGTHGIARPGGSALNAGQVGSLRAAQYICQKGRSIPEEAAFFRALQPVLDKYLSQKESFLSRPDNVQQQIAIARRRMSDYASAIRASEQLGRALDEAAAQLYAMASTVGASETTLPLIYRLHDTLTTQLAVLTAMLHYAETVGTTQGSCLYFDEQGQLRDGLEAGFRFTPGSGTTNGQVQQTHWDGNAFRCSWRPVRPIPDDDDFFENIWREYRIHKNIY